MPHHLYHTDGLILSAQNYGEANTLYQILSPDLGLVSALAQGARYSRSKLRPHLALLDHVRLTLVRGRELWRLTAAESSRHLQLLRQSPEKLVTWMRIATLLRRLVRGEQRDRELFSDLLVGLGRFSEDNERESATYEQLIVLRLLSRLGYIGSAPTLLPWLAPGLWHERGWSLSPDMATELLRQINQGLEHSQL